MVHTIPLVTPRAVGPDANLLRHQLALDDEHPPAMHDQVIDLAHPGRTIVFRLLRIFEAQTVKDVNFPVLVEPAVQVVCAICFSAAAPAR